MIDGIFTKIREKWSYNHLILEMRLDGPMHTEYETLQYISQIIFKIEKNAQHPQACFIS